MENRFNERKLFLKSLQLFSFGLMATLAISLGLDDFSYLFGLILGYGICVINFRFHIMVIDALLGTMTKWSMVLVISSRVIQMAIYATGLLLAIFLPKLFNLVSVAIGYMFIKAGIYILSFQRK